MKKTTLIITTLIILALIGSGVYWYLFLRVPAVETGTDTTTQNGFSPFNKGTTTNKPPVKQSSSTSTPEQQNTPVKLLTLRKLSATPVGGMSASTTANTAVIRFIDRGAGHIYEANDKSNEITKISNTTLPKIYESYWNKNLTALVIRYLKEDTNTITNFYAEIRKTSTTTSTTPFGIKGSYMSPDIDQIAVSPNGDRIFTWNIENGKGVGYISNFDERNKIRVINGQLTQVLIDWPENNTVTMTTKASANASGYAYTIDTKTGSMKKIIGGLRGLSTKTSKDVKKTLYSVSKNNGFSTALYNSKDESIQDVIFNTLADKCIWSTLRKNEVYCAVPTEIPSGIYPDDWYKGSVQFVDQIWYLDTTTGEVHLLANLLNLSNELIDATQLTLDPKENFLYFINKRDLSLWSLDLSQ